jgi:hypothetical protein
LRAKAAVSEEEILTQDCSIETSPYFTAYCLEYFELEAVSLESGGVAQW